MTEIVGQWDRNQAKDQARNLTVHNLHLIWDATREAVDCKDPDALINAVNKVAALTARTQQAAHNYKGYFLAWKENEPKPEPLPATLPEAVEAAGTATEERAAAAAGDLPL